MNGIIITSIICISLIIIVGLICYSNWRNKNGDDLSHIHRRIDLIHDKINHYFGSDIDNKIKFKEYLDKYKTSIEEINNIKTIINSIQTGIEFISMQISNKENKNE